MTLTIFHFYFLLLLHKCKYVQQVMSPDKRDEGAAEHAAPVVVVDGQDKVTDDHLEEKSAAPLAAMN